MEDRLDFAEHELTAYLTPIEAGSLPATDLTDRAKIPQTRVYDVVRDVERRGLVDVREGRPMTVAALNPDQAVASLAVKTGAEGHHVAVGGRVTACEDIETLYIEVPRR